MVKIGFLEHDIRNNFLSTDLVSLNRGNTGLLNNNSLEESLKNTNIFLTVEDGSRLLTHAICESCDSYTQQSQRYVNVDKEGFVIPDDLDGRLREEFIESNNFLLKIYSKLSERKPEFKDKKGRPTAEWFKYGVPIEDARYVLPLAVKSNISITLTGNKLPELIGRIGTLNNPESEKLLSDLQSMLPEKLEPLFKSPKAYNYLNLNNLNNPEGLLYSITKHPVRNVGIGALTSTQAETPSSLMMTKSLNDLEKTVKRVLGYGHESIAEHFRFSLLLDLSLTSYHQYERHRLPVNIREDFYSIPVSRDYVVPPSIANNDEALKMYKMAIFEGKAFREKLMEENPKAAPYMLLNAEKVYVLSNMNARIAKDIFEKRLCNNAQWEIRGKMDEALQELKKYDDKGLFFGKAGPKCVAGSCPEGDLSCGKAKEMREKYL